MTNETSAERVQRRWDERASERAARRERVAKMGVGQRTLTRTGDFLRATGSLLIVAIVLTVIVWFVWYVVTGVISADWERAGG